MVYKIKQLISTAFCPSLALHFSSSVLPWLVVVCEVWSWSREVKRHSLKNELASYIINELSWNSCFVLNIVWISHQEIKSNFQLENLFLCTTGTALMIWKLKKKKQLHFDQQSINLLLILLLFLIFVVKQAAENLASILLKETFFKHIN